MNSFLSGHRTELLIGSLPPSGTLTGPIDLAEYTEFGLVGVGSLTPTTLFFRAGVTVDGPHARIKDASGNDASITVAGSAGVIAVSGAALTFLKPFRYVRIETSAAQSGGYIFNIWAKA